MPITTIPDELGSLRFGIQGQWSCADVSRFLAKTEETYQRLASVFVISTAIEQELKYNTEPGEQQYPEFSWHNLYFGGHFARDFHVVWEEAPEYPKLLALTSVIAPPLTIDGIFYESPGWIQLNGSWNPLKVLADFISRWRSENTRREEIRSKAGIESKRIDKEFAAEIFKHLPKEHRYQAASRLLDIADHVIKPATEYIESTAVDWRITETKLLAPGEPLPHRRRSRKRRN
jgi:hypothetical protein